jgi:hypothetical protein
LLLETLDFYRMVSGDSNMAKWRHNPISAKAGAPAAAGKPAGFAWENDKTQHIVYRGQDNQIHELWFCHGVFNAEWKYGGAISAKTGGQPTAGDPFGFSWESDKTQHIVYRGQDGQIHEIWFKKDLAGAKWAYGGALTAKTGAPAGGERPHRLRVGRRQLAARRLSRRRQPGARTVDEEIAQRGNSLRYKCKRRTGPSAALVL